MLQHDALQGQVTLTHPLSTSVSLVHRTRAFVICSGALESQSAFNTEMAVAV